MRALTVRQPWAWAIIHGGKDVENRSRSLGPYRGPVAIHAGLMIDDDARWSLTLRQAWHGAFLPERVEPDAPGFMLPVLRESYEEDASWLPTGVVIGVVDLVDVHDDGDCLHRSTRALARLYRTDPDAFHALPDDGAGGVIGRTRLCSPWAQGDHHHLVLANPRPLTEPIPWRGALGMWTVPADLEAAIREQVTL